MVAYYYSIVLTICYLLIKEENNQSESIKTEKQEYAFTIFQPDENPQCIDSAISSFVPYKCQNL